MASLDIDAQKREAQMEYSRREMMRKSLDTIRLYNPLDHNFVYKFDGFNHTVPAKGTKDEPRYLARHYFKKIAEYMIGLQSMARGEDLLKLREKQFGKGYLDKYVENKEVWDKVPRIDDNTLLNEIRDIVILGLVEEYGMDMVPESEAVTSRAPDMTSLSDQVFDQEDRRILTTDTPIMTKPVISKTSKPSLTEVTL